MTDTTDEAIPNLLAARREGLGDAPAPASGGDGDADDIRGTVEAHNEAAIAHIRDQIAAEHNSPRAAGCADDALGQLCDGQTVAADEGAVPVMQRTGNRPS
jgi:hypothetical protein